MNSQFPLFSPVPLWDGLGSPSHDTHKVSNVTIPEALQLAMAHHQAGRLADAEALYRQILQADPNHGNTLHLLGFLLHQQGQHELAVEHIQRAIKQVGPQPVFYHNLGEAFRALGKISEAITCHERALELQPNMLEARFNLALALQQSGRLNEAAACYQQALRLAPNDADTYNALGNVAKEQGQAAEAIEYYQTALRLRPEFPEALTNLGNTLREQGRLADALPCYRRALAMRPDNAEYHNNVGNVLRNQGRLTDALACYQTAVRFKPDYAIAHYNMGLVFHEERRLDAALPCYEKALQFDPTMPAAIGHVVHIRQHLCLWQDLDKLAMQVIKLGLKLTTKNRVAPFTFLTLPEPISAEEQLLCTERFVQERFAAAMNAGLRRPRRNIDKTRRRMRLGYLSADFQTHATAHLITELFEKHDKDRFEVFGYSYGADDASPCRQRIAQACAHFVDLFAVSNYDAVERIAADEIDILVDLKGHTGHARTEILAQRPAPIQVNYLGYPGTMGAPFMDYILVDDYVVPADQQPFFSEKLVHLPGCYQVNDSRRPIAEHTPTRADCGLPPEGFVFCSFNNNYKITPSMFDVWMKLLHAVPQSVLWLLECNPHAPGNLRREAAARGVAGERLIFAPKVALPEHLARHRMADLYLDTFPVNAHTSASDTLWAGCPIVTLSGTTFISRVAGSLLRALDLAELITTSFEAYHDVALRLAREPEYLASIRSRLAAHRKTSALFDSSRFARNLEAAYLSMWDVAANASGVSLPPIIGQ